MDFKFSKHVPQVPKLPTGLKGTNYFKWVQFGDDNLFPETLKEYSTLAPTHSSMVETLATSITGYGLKSSGNAVEWIYKNWERTWADDILSNVAKDISVYNAFALQVVWSNDGTQVTNVYHIPVDSVRLSNPENKTAQLNGYYISKDWANRTMNQPVFVKEYNPKTALEDKYQIMYVPFDRSYNRWYSLPGYVSAMNWIKLEHELSTYNLSLVMNSAVPTTVFSIPTQSPSEEEKEATYRQFKKSFQGTDKAGSFLLHWTGNTDSDINKMITTVNPSITEGHFEKLIAEAKQQILTAHKATSPVLAAIPTLGTIGGDGAEIQTAWGIYNRQVVAKYHKTIQAVFNELLEMSNVTDKVAIEPWLPLETSTQ